MKVAEQAQKLIPSPHTLEVGAKTSAGFGGSLLAMSLNEWAGLVVAILTAFYMVLQIQDILRKRKLDAQPRNDN